MMGNCVRRLPLLDAKRLPGRGTGNMYYNAINNKAKKSQQHQRSMSDFVGGSGLVSNSTQPGHMKKSSHDLRLSVPPHLRGSRPVSRDISRLIGKD